MYVFLSGALDQMLAIYRNETMPSRGTIIYIILISQVYCFNHLAATQVQHNGFSEPLVEKLS